MKLFGKKNGPKAATGGGVAKKNAGRSSSSKGGAAGKDGREDLEVATIGTTKTNGNATVDSTRTTKRADNLSGTSTFQRTMSYLASFFSMGHLNAELDARAAPARLRCPRHDEGNPT